jgi:AAA domain/DnaB-like helicase N terminal domain
MKVNNDTLPPSCPEAERGVLGCCLLNTGKTAIALKAGVSSRWFYDLRHIEIFNILAAMARNGGGDSLVATLKLRELGKLEHIGGSAYLSELQDAVPSAENLEFYLPDLRAYFQRRQVIDIGTRLRLLAQDPTADPATLFADTGNLLQHLQAQGEAAALPEIVHANDFLAADIPTPPEIVSGVLHQGSKLILGGYSKSYKTWTLADLALSVATGTPWLGFDTTAGKVLYVNLEIQAGFFRKRVMQMARAKHLELKEQPDIWNLRGHPADYRVLLPKIRNRIRDEGYSLVIIDPTYKLLGIADENSATDITALLNMVDSVATTTGAAVVLAGHFAKGNASAKETIDRISGSGVFARDPDSLVVFTKHEEEGAFVVEMILRNLPPVAPFVVKWQYPLFLRENSLDPTRLKQMGGRPAKHKADDLLDLLGDQRLKSGQWSKLASTELGITNGPFFALVNKLEDAGEVQKSALDAKWERVQKRSKTPRYDKDE